MLRCPALTRGDLCCAQLILLRGPALTGGYCEELYISVIFYEFHSELEAGAWLSIELDVKEYLF